MPKAAPSTTYAAEWKPTYQASHVGSKAISTAFQHLEHVPDEVFPTNMVQRWGFTDWIASPDPDTPRVFPRPLLHIPCKASGRGCKDCKNHTPRFIYTHDDIKCQTASRNGHPTLLFRFHFSSDQRSVAVFTCAWCAVKKMTVCDLISKGRHKLVMLKGTDKIVLEVGKPPKTMPTNGSESRSTKDQPTNQFQAAQAKDEDLPLHLAVFPPPPKDPMFPQYGLIEGTLDAVNIALEQWKTTDDYKRKLAERSPQHVAGGSKRRRVEIEGPLSLTQLSDKYPSIFGEANGNNRPWMTESRLGEKAIQANYAVYKAPGPAAEEEQFWRGNKYGMKPEGVDMAKRDINQENTILRAQVDAAHTRMLNFEDPRTSWQVVHPASLPHQAREFAVPPWQGQGGFGMVLESREEGGKPISWMGNRQFEEKMTAKEWGSGMMKVFEGDENDSL